MKNVRKLLAAELETERQFVAEAAHESPHPTGWSAALLMFHVGQWRERLRDALSQVSRGQAYTPPPDNIDEFNDAELAAGAGSSFEEAAKRSESALVGLIALWDSMGDRPFTWYVANTTGEAVIRNSYHHPRIHIAEQFMERGQAARGHTILEESAAELRKALAPPHILGAALYNLACVRVAQGRADEALTLLEDALPMRPDLRSAADGDRDLTPLRNNPRFLAIVRS